MARGAARVCTVVCVDAKLNFDDNAEFRQKDIYALVYVWCCCVHVLTLARSDHFRFSWPLPIEEAAP